MTRGEIQVLTALEMNMLVFRAETPVGLLRT
jgi:hypothetical protein